MRRIVVLLALLVTAACAGKQFVSQGQGHPEIGTWGFDLGGMDRAVKPGDDFFRYANGKWYDKAVIPADRSTIGSFSSLNIRSEDELRGILQDLQTRPDLDAEQSKVRDLYRSYVDTDRIEALGLKPAAHDLKTIAKLNSYDDVARVMASVRMGTESVFGAAIRTDRKNPGAYMVTLFPSGLGLPDRDYYLIDEKGTVAARDGYHAFIAKMLSLGGIADARKKADRIFALETAIAKLHWPAAERRNADKTYNPMTEAELVRLVPKFPWAPFLKELEIGNPPQGERVLNVTEKSAFPELAALFARTPIPVWRDYLTFHYLRSHASLLPKRFDEANFDFYGKILTGNEQQLERAKRGAHFVDDNIGEALGKLYVAKYFPPAAKAKARELVANLIATYVDHIKTRDWMTDATKRQALEKLSHLMIKIGYPDKWRDYSSYLVKPDDLIGNAARGSEFEWNRELKRLDDSVDRSEWGMTPPTVNAYYNPTINEIVFPAAILQPPFFDPNADDAVNYGGIGAVIGHEISHGFDDQGSKFDATGKMENWWTPEDRKNFEAKTNVLVAQYNEYVPIEGLHVNGNLTLGENIGDLSGLTISYAAYHRALNGRAAPVLDGFTGDQRLFLGFAQIWREKAREGYLRQRVLSNPHSPPMFRVNGTVRNVDGWYDAFGIAPGQKYYLAPDARVHLW